MKGTNWSKKKMFLRGQLASLPCLMYVYISPQVIKTLNKYNTLLRVLQNDCGLDGNRLELSNPSDTYWLF